jgi:hypothetical protein
MAKASETLSGRGLLTRPRSLRAENITQGDSIDRCFITAKYFRLQHSKIEDEFEFEDDWVDETPTSASG